MIEIIELFKQKMQEIPEGFDINYPEKVTDFKQIRYKDWSNYLQYQFLERNNYIGVEIHLESEKLKPLADILKPYVEVIKDLAEFKQASDIKWDPLWYINQKSGGAGRLVIEFPKNTFPSVIVNAMINLINLTFDDISDNLPNDNSSVDSNNSKDKTKYKFNNVIYGKNRLVLEVLKHYTKDNPNISYQQLETTFPKKLQGSFGVFNKKEKAKLSHQRFFFEPKDILKTLDEEIAVCNQWGKGNIEKFVDRARELGFQIEELTDLDEKSIFDKFIEYYKNYIPEGYAILEIPNNQRFSFGIKKNTDSFPDPYYMFTYFTPVGKFMVEMHISQNKFSKFNEEITNLRKELSNVNCFNKFVSLNDSIVSGYYKSMYLSIEPNLRDLNTPTKVNEFCNLAKDTMNILIEKTQFIFDQKEDEMPLTQQVTELPSVKILPPLNVILYGPPGTGKTFNSINYAVSIIEEKELKVLEAESQTNRAEVEKRFNDYREEGRVEFITFHQSYSYEDFIQGLKPDTDGEGQLSFNRKDGLFKIIAERAMKGGNFDDIYEKFKDDIDGMPNSVLNLKTKTHSKDFSIRINSRGSCTIVPSTQKATEMTLTKRVIKEYLVNGKKLDWPSYLVPVCEYIKDTYNPVMSDENNKSKNFVIIIDEINRANISRVFGELITLIEPDKRETLKVTLPSGETFSVPKNLYIVGTMNTADKSIALLDIALRRRFKFIGKYPDYSLIPEFKEYLKPINEEIKKRKKSSDFMIGHSYFMNRSKDHFADILNNEIIPLLNEYFNNKTEVVEEILKAGKIEYEIDEDTFQIVAREQA